MAIRQLYTEQQYEDGGYDPFSADEGFLRQVVSAPTPAPPPALSAPPAPALVAAPPPAIAAPAPAPVISAPAATSTYKFDPSTLGEAQQYFFAPNVDRETWEALLREQEVAREMPAERYDRFSYRGIPKLVPEDYESWVQQQYLQADRSAREALRNRQTGDLTKYFQEQWQGYGIDPSIKGINRANELAQILAHYGLTDFSKLGVKTSPYEEMRGGWQGGDAGEYIESLYKGNRGQLTYGDKTYGSLIGVGGKGEQDYKTRDPFEYLEDYSAQAYKLSGSAAGKGAVDYLILKDEQGNLRKDAQGRPIIVPQWRSTSDVTPELIQFLSIAAMPFTGGLAGALGGGLAGQIGAQALISGGLGGLSAAAQGGDFLSGFGKGALTGGLTAGIGSLAAPAVDAVGASVLDATKSQVLADIAQGAIRGGAGALPGAIMSGDFGNVLTGALTGGVGSGVSSGLENIKFSDTPSVNNAIIQGAGDLAAAATRAAVTGQDLNVVNALMPAIAQGISEEYKLPVRQVTAGLQVASKLLQGGDLSPADILKLGTSLSSSGTKPTAGHAASAGYGGAETEDFFDSEEAQAVQDDIQSILTRYPEAAPAPFFPEFEEALLTQKPVVPTPAPPPEQSYEVIAPAPAPAVFDLPEEVLSVLSPAPQAKPISDLEKALFQEANVMPEQPQEIVTTGAKPEALLPELPAQPELKDVQDYIQSIINAEAALPPDQTVVTTGSLPEQTLYELPEAPVMQDLYQPPGQLEGPSTIETTGTKLPEVPVIPLEDVPEVLAPPVEAPTIPAPTPTAPPAPGATTPPAVAPAAPTQAPKKQDDLALLMMLAAMMTPQQKEEEQYQLAQILGVESPFGRIV